MAGEFGTPEEQLAGISNKLERLIVTQERIATALEALVVQGQWAQAASSGLTFADLAADLRVFRANITEVPDDH